MLIDFKCGHAVDIKSEGAIKIALLGAGRCPDCSIKRRKSVAGQRMNRFHAGKSKRKG